MKRLQLVGWKHDAVMTSVSSSMFSGLMSTMLKLIWLLFMFHRLMRRSSADKKVSPSEQGEMELTWYAWALAYTRRGVAHTAVSRHVSVGILRFLTLVGAPYRPRGRFIDDTIFSFFSKTFHSFIVLSAHSGRTDGRCE